MSETKKNTEKQMTVLRKIREAIGLNRKGFFLAVSFVVWYTYTEALLSETIGELSDLGQAGYLTA